MTFTFKLARRIAVARARVLLPLPLVLFAAACGTPIVTEGFAPPDSTDVVAITVEPKLDTIRANDSVQFHARGQDALGDTVTADVDWFASGGTITANGVFSSSSTGRFTLLARHKKKQQLADTATVVVIPALATVSAVVVSPSSLTLAPRGSAPLSASARMSDGSTTTVSVTWSATGGTITTSGAYTAGATPGSFRIIASEVGGTHADTVPVTITAPTLSAIFVTPATVSLATGATQQFSASGQLSDGSSTGVSVNWSATGGTITSAGLYTAGTTAGTFRVIATQAGGTLADTALVGVAVPPPTLQQVILTPASASLLTGASQQFAASGLMSDGSGTSVSVTWTATGGTVTAGGLYTAGSTAGTYRVIARQSGGTLADTSVVTVTAPTLQQVVLTPATVSMVSGTIQQFSASGRLSDGSVSSVSVTYNATGGTITSGGLYTAGSTAGTFRVIATQSGGTLADTSSVTVTAATLTQVILLPPTTTVTSGMTQQFTVSGILSNGATTTPSVTYSATGGTITTGGLYTAGATSGTFRVIATQQGGTLADTSGVTVTTATLTQVILQPATLSLATGGVQQFTVSGILSNGATTTPAVTYSATGGTISSGGLYTAGATTGSFRVIATQQGGTLADTSAVTITAPAVLQAVILTPASASVVTGGTQQFAVSGQWSNGATTAPAVTYSATGGTITTGGLYTAGSTTGTFRVIAVQQGGTLADTSAVTVSAGGTPGYPNQPAGYTVFLENNFSALPLWPPQVLPAPTLGWWYGYPGGSSNPNLTIQSDVAAPQSPSAVIQTRYPAGQAAGSAPVDMGGWGGTSEGGAQKTAFYFSMWVKIAGATFEDHPTATKFGFIAYGEAPGGGDNQGYWTLDGDGTQTPASSLPVSFRQQNNVGRSMPQNVNTSRLMTAGTWHHWEAVFQLNTLGQSNGVFRMWIDGVQTHNYADVVYATSGATNGFFLWKWNPTWGGYDGPVKQRDDFVQIDHIYLSGP